MNEKRVLHSWTPIGQPTKGGHRYFVPTTCDVGEVSPRGVAIADNSGDTPDDTEDGTLWIDTDGTVWIESLIDGGPIVAAIPVTAQRGVKSDYQVCVPIRDIVWLIKQGIVPADNVELGALAEEMMELAEALNA